MPATEASVANGLPFADSRQKPEGPASVLAIGIANPPHVFDQSTYPDFFFDITNCNEKTELKRKFQRIWNGVALIYCVWTNSIY
ncbi:hypothetical protein O6H91_10G012500 [Diphasiastrum complanatum]|uniref:Uncharacterized protein n=1 Tax=Diphasiastrum complanatum TaxID=34168 RepID=A0ACC2CEF8_DIPCM|nr:hypothetical protein O6H91_10G012500 [Diphasiastrum complanatum]